MKRKPIHVEIFDIPVEDVLGVTQAVEAIEQGLS